VLHLFCRSLGLSYTDVFKHRNSISRIVLTGEITRQQLQEVDSARRRLQGIWDNIMDDYKSDLLGGPITGPRHGSMLRRGLAYMELVEPLEAANFARLQSVNSRVKSQGPYVLPATTSRSQSTGCDAAKALQTPRATDSESNSLMDAAIICRSGARQSRFR
jgi:hypothetical protein